MTENNPTFGTVDVWLVGTGFGGGFGGSRGIAAVVRRSGRAVLRSCCLLEYGGKRKGSDKLWWKGEERGGAPEG